MKLFKKEKYSNGRRHIYFMGIKIASYMKHHKQVDATTEPDAVEKIRTLGVHVGKNVRFIIWPHSWSYPDFGSEPYLISIGDDTCISFQVTFLTHDASIHVCEKFDKKCPKLIKFGRISVGKNCFIGCRCIIMPGVTIGDNCVIGSGSVVTKSVPEGEVWAGNPAHFISNISDYTKKMIKHSQDEEHKKLFEIVVAERKKSIKSGK